MIDFREAVKYGKYMFGKDFDYCSEDDNGYVGFFLKSDPGVAHECQTWDELEHEWNCVKDVILKHKTTKTKRRKKK